jgi:DNA-binding winged helix-turn-helix (wHTH) protein
MTSESRGAIARFGAFELDVPAAELRRSGRLVSLTGQPIRVLITLVTRAGAVVTRDDLQRELWGDDTHVDFEAGLSTCIHQIRTALVDRAVAPRFVETLPKRGYRFVAPVEWIAEPEPARARLSKDTLANTGRKPTIGASLAFTAVVAAVISLGWVATRSMRPLVPMVMLWMEVDPARDDLQSVSRTLYDALIGALNVEGGSRARVLSPIAAEKYRYAPPAAAERDGVGYVVFVTLRSAGGPALVHVKLVGPGGWVRWTIDRVMPVEELTQQTLPLAAEVSKSIVSRMLADESN